MTDKPTKPVEPGPRRTEAEQSQYAQDMSKWSDWIKDHPEDAEPAPELTPAETNDG